ncbi:MAG: aromatic ring-hydroxylating oxygenase subunit alpha [Candidatus Polarisedimenticolia bacterium]
MKSLREVLDAYDPKASLERAFTIPASWYVDPRVADLEAKGVFGGTWQMVGRADQVASAGDYVTATLAGEPVVVVRGDDGELRGFFNVCRHHAAAVMTEPAGRARSLRCPYHGWTYGLDGALKVTPDFTGVCDFDRARNGLVPLAAGIWENWVFVRLSQDGPSLEEFVGADLIAQIGPLGLSGLHWMERRHYAFECNWKVFVDNYLDGGYHVPYLHKGLDSVLDYGRYAIENGERHCLQHSPIVKEGAEAQTGAVRGGDRALYYWVYPNFMINWYEGVMDTNLVLPRGVDRTEVIFDFWFPDVTSEQARARNKASIEVGQRIQDEDTAICMQVQRGLASRAYQAGRLSVRREAGEHLFHRLLHADLSRTLGGEGSFSPPPSH